MPDPSALAKRLREFRVVLDYGDQSTASVITICAAAADYIEASEKREAALRALCAGESSVFVDEIRALYPEWGEAEA